MVDIFKCGSAVEFLESKIEENSNKYGYKARLANAARCQRPYLSLVLKRKVQLTMEHAMGLTQFWGLTDSETQYFLNLVMKDRSGTKPLRDFIQRRLEELIQVQSNLGRRYKQQDIPLRDQSIYYSSWLYGAVHMLLTVPQFQTIDAISERLGMKQNKIERILKDLATIGFATESSGRWKASHKSVHVSADSPFNVINHGNWRQRAVLSVQAKQKTDLHYSAVYSLSISDMERLKQALIQFIDQSRDVVTKSPEEEVVCFNCDFFMI